MLRPRQGTENGIRASIGLAFSQAERINMPYVNARITKDGVTPEQ